MIGQSTEYSSPIIVISNPSYIMLKWAVDGIYWTQQRNVKGVTKSVDHFRAVSFLEIEQSTLLWIHY